MHARKWYDSDRSFIEYAHLDYLREEYECRFDDDPEEAAFELIFLENLDVDDLRYVLDISEEKAAAIYERYLKHYAN